MKPVLDRIPEGVWLLIIPASIFLAGYAFLIGVCAL